MLVLLRDGVIVEVFVAGSIARTKEQMVLHGKNAERSEQKSDGLEIVAVPDELVGPRIGPFGWSSLSPDERTQIEDAVVSALDD